MLPNQHYSILIVYAYEPWDCNIDHYNFMVTNLNLLVNLMNSISSI